MIGRRAWGWLSVIGVALTLVFCLPFTVQSGASGELVAAAYRGFNAHPPGYPLFLWLQGVFLHIFPGGSIFWRASLLNAFFIVGCLAFLYRPFQKLPWVGSLFVLSLALSPLFFRMSLLPDIFGLHAFFLAGFSYFFFWGEKNRSQLLPLFFFLGVANHPSFLFLLPALIFGMWNRPAPGRILSTVSGIVLVYVLYGSLFIRNPESFYSWGHIADESSLWNHFLLSDLRAVRFEMSFEEVLFLLKGVAGNILPILCLAVTAWFGLKGKFGRKRVLIYGFCLTAYFLTFAFVLKPSVRMNLIQQERFFLSLILMVVFLLAYLSSHLGEKRRIAFAISFVAFLVLSGPTWRENRSLAGNTIVEDYALNLLRMTDKKRRSMVVAGSDTVYFATRYVQTVHNFRSDVLVLSPSLLESDWYLRKLHARDAGFHFGGDFSKLDDHLYEPNLDRYDIHVTEKVPIASRYRVVYQGVGRRVKRGSGTVFDDYSTARMKFRSRPAGRESRFDPSRQLFSQYSLFSLVRGQVALEGGQKRIAQHYFEEAEKLCGDCPPVRKALCQIAPEGC